MVSRLKNRVANGLNMGGDGSSSSGPEDYGDKYILRISSGPSYVSIKREFSITSSFNTDNESYRTNQHINMFL